MGSQNLFERIKYCLKKVPPEVVQQFASSIKRRLNAVYKRMQYFFTAIIALSLVSKLKILKKDASMISDDDASMIMMSVFDEAFSQVTSRLPSAMGTYKNVSNLNLDIILNKVSRPMISEVPFLHLTKDGLIEE